MDVLVSHEGTTAWTQEVEQRMEQLPSDNPNPNPPLVAKPNQ